MLGDHDLNEQSDDRRDIIAHGRLGSPQELVDRYRSGSTWYSEVPAQEGLNLSQYWRVILKHRWIIVACFIGAIAVGLAVTLLMTPIYHAETTIKIDREAAHIVNVGQIEPPEAPGTSEEFFQTQYGLLHARKLASSVVDKLGLANGDEFFKDMNVKLGTKGPAPTLSDRQRIATNILQANLTVSPVRGSRLVKVGFNSPNAALAAKVANATALQFIESSLQSRYDSSDYARAFLEKMLAETKAKLEESERAAQDYATKEGIINVAPTNPDGNAASNNSTQSLAVTSLVSLNNALSVAHGDRIRAEERWRQSQTAAAASLPEVLQNPNIQQLTEARAKMQSDLQELRSRYKDDYPDVANLRARISETDKQIQAQMVNIQNSLKVAYDVALSQEKSFESQVNKDQKDALDVGQRSIQYGILMRETDTNRTIYDGLLQRFKEVGVTGGISTNNISVVDPAETPRSPSKPHPLINLVVSAIAGITAGMLLAFLLDTLDESIATPEDVEEKLGLPLLGTAPKVSKSENPDQVLKDPRSGLSEAYYSIRTALQFSTPQGAPQSLLVTSSRPAEGKSTTAMAIAEHFARVGVSVLLVDGDMRNPSLHRRLAQDSSKGLSNVLTGAMSVMDVASVTDVPNLSFIPCGPLPPNPAELLASDSLKLFIGEALKSFHMVVIDGPPVMGLADAPALAASVAGTVFVVESRGTRRGLGATAIRRLRLGNARLLGIVLTKFDVKQSAYGYGSSYAYAYDYNYGTKPRLSDS